MSVPIIAIDYSELERIQKEIAQHAEKVLQITNYLRRCVDLLKQKWVSDAADAFFDEAERKLFPGMKRLHDSLEFGGQVLREVAKIYRDAEEQASALYQRLDTTAEATGKIIPENVMDALKLLANTGDFLGGLGKFGIEISPRLKALSKYFKAVGIAEIFLSGINKISEDGVSLETFAEFAGKTGTEFLIAKHPIGATVLLGNTVIQVGGKLTIGAGELWRDAITGGDASLRSSQIMSTAIKGFRETLDNANLDHVLDGIGELAGDAAQVYFGIPFQQAQKLFENPSWGNAAELATMIAARTNSITAGFEIARELSHNPQLVDEIVKNGMALGGDTIDAAIGLARLPAVTADLVGGMVTGTVVRGVEVLPLSDSTKEALINIAEDAQSVQQTVTRLTSPAGALPAFDAGDAARKASEAVSAAINSALPASSGASVPTFIPIPSFSGMNIL